MVLDLHLTENIWLNQQRRCWIISLNLHRVRPALVVQSLSGGPALATTWLQREWWALLYSLFQMHIQCQTFYVPFVYLEILFHSFSPTFDMFLFLLAQMVCSDITQFACDNLCGNPLPCGNHYCSYTCHPLEIRSSSLDKRSESCEKCDLRCQKVLVLLFLSHTTYSIIFPYVADLDWRLVISCHWSLYLLMLKALYWVS